MPKIDLKEVAIAWFRSYHPTPEQQELASYRLSVCDSCEHKHWRASFEEYSCAACGCPLIKKVFSPKPGPVACPTAKWER